MSDNFSEHLRTVEYIYLRHGHRPLYLDGEKEPTKSPAPSPKVKSPRSESVNDRNSVEKCDKQDTQQTRADDEDDEIMSTIDDFNL